MFEVKKVKKNKQMDITEENLIRIQEKIEKLKTNKFKQQTLLAWKPVPTYATAAISSCIFSVVFLVTGIFLYTYSKEIIMVTQRYDECGGISEHCRYDLIIDTPMQAP